MDKLGNNIIHPFMEICQEKGYNWFDAKRPYNLNIIGVRNSSPVNNLFNDFIFVIFRNEIGLWVAKQYPATTKPGLPYLLDPINPEGTAILKEGQYRGLWSIGMHKTKYEALVQVKPVTVIRDVNRDSEFSYTGKEDKGLFGINLHRASATEPKVIINRYSAGCQVLQSPNDFKDLMFTVHRAVKLGMPNSFTYTLINSNDF